MTQDLAARLTDPALVIAVLVAIAVFATLYTIAIPYLERGDLEKRMKAVSTEREQIRARERARMNADGGRGKASLRASHNHSVRQIVEKFNLRQALVDDATMDKLKAA
ncbi:MAG: type II secretion system F family protein, partial [Rhizobiaceae bacterium]|nr:type II secretion system F family protein [Rhizobiaceae bacterium]